MNDIELKKVHSLELDIAQEIKRICEKHRIKYFMIAGTLLGAIRHKGFIPWDEDMDFGMLRSDFERFVQACRTDLDTNRFFLQTNESDKGYTYAFAKLRLKGTRIVESVSENASADQGIFVDIFPFDNVPDKKWQSTLHEKERYIWKNILAVKLGYKNGMHRSKALQVILKAVASVLPYQFILSRKNKAFTRYNKKKSENIVTAEGSYRYKKETIPGRYVEKLVNLPFEEMEFPAFACYEEYLTGMYGDYMKLPPADKRNKHAIQEVDFGPYKD